MDKGNAEGPVGGWETLSSHTGSVSSKGRDCTGEEGAQRAFRNDNRNEDVLMQVVHPDGERVKPTGKREWS